MKIFKQENIDEEFKALGFKRYGRISDTAIENLITLDNSLKIPDYVGCDFNVGMNSDVYLLRKKMQENLFDILSPFFTDILDEYDFFSASFVNKKPNKKFLIAAHQDFTYCDENQAPSFMAWIPLVDTTIENGAIGFIPKSHLFYNYKRAFPFPLSYSPIVLNEIELMKYLEIQEMNKGEIVFFYNKTVHGSFPNYTNKIRYAMNISFIKKGHQPELYIKDPSQSKATIIKYKADSNFLIQYNNPRILEMYKNGKIEIENYPVIGAELFGDYDTTWNSVLEKLEANDLKIQPENIKYLNRFLNLKKMMSVKDLIYNTIVSLFHKIKND